MICGRSTDRALRGGVESGKAFRKFGAAKAENRATLARVLSGSEMLGRLMSSFNRRTTGEDDAPGDGQENP